MESGHNRTLPIETDISAQIDKHGGNLNSILGSYVESVVGPAPELQLAILVVKGEPSDVYLTGGFEDPCKETVMKLTSVLLVSLIEGFGQWANYFMCNLREGK